MLVWLAHHEADHTPDDGQTIVEVPDGSDPNNLFFDGEQAVARQDVPLRSDRTVIACGETVTVRDAPALICVNGERVPVEGGHYAVSSDVPAVIRIEAIGTHRSPPIIIRVDHAAALLDEVRVQRNALLAQSDWTQTGDAPIAAEKKQAWAAYRVALRDLPEKQPAATVETVEWPTML
jgi:hypothetical protein